MEKKTSPQFDKELADAIRALAETPEEERRAMEWHSGWANNELENLDE